MKLFSACLTFLAIAIVGTTNAAEEEPPSIEGTITLETSAESAEAAAPTVVWIDEIPDEGDPLKKIVIAQKSSKFTPDFAVAVVGQEVQMPNLDNIAHNAFSQSEGNEFDVGIYPKGSSKSVHFKKSGIVDVRCRMHKRMHCTIVVVPNRHFQVIKPEEPSTSRAIKLADVPDGLHTLRVWQRGFKMHEMKVEVKNGTCEALDIRLVPEPADVAAAGSH